MVKWLSSIHVSEEETSNFYHVYDNHLLPPQADTVEKAEHEGWWKKPEFIFNELNINSSAWAPAHGDVAALSAGGKRVEVAGYAYTGGGRWIVRVEVSLDGGCAWELAKILPPPKPEPHPRGKRWTWALWRTEVDPVAALRGGEARALSASIFTPPFICLFTGSQIAVRAWDDSMNRQPEVGSWNLLGEGNNGYFRIKVHPMRTEKGEAAVWFEHPVQAGKQPGGWIVDPRSPAACAPQPHPSVAAHAEGEEAAHPAHPAPPERPVAKQHLAMDEARRQLQRLLLRPSEREGGTAEQAPAAGEPAAARGPAGPPVALDPHRKIAVPLIGKESVSHDTRRFRFGLPSGDHQLGLPVGQHIVLSARIDGKPVARPYTPIYMAGVNPRFPAGGVFSQYLDRLKIGETVDVKGPVGDITYQGRGEFEVKGEGKRCRRVAMIAGGTGITPIYQVAQAMLADREDATETEGDILLRPELDAMERGSAGRVRVWYTLDAAPPGGAWPYSVGFVSEATVREHLPGAGEEALALMCGPPPMLEHAAGPALLAAGYSRDRIVAF
eukprot:tig00020904_g15148.t1